MFRRQRIEVTSDIRTPHMIVCSNLGSSRALFAGALRPLAWRARLGTIHRSWQIPASRVILGRQPSALSFHMSSGFREVPTGLEASKTKRPLRPTTSAISLVRRDGQLRAGPDLDRLIVSLPCRGGHAHMSSAISGPKKFRSIPKLRINCSLYGLLRSRWRLRQQCGLCYCVLGLRGKCRRAAESPMRWAGEPPASRKLI